MTHSLTDILKAKVTDWRRLGFKSDFPAISEILEYNMFMDETGAMSLRYLRKAQFEALVTYWYLRLVECTPHIFDLYKKYFTNPSELLKSMGINLSNEDLMEFLLSRGGIDSIFEKIKTDNEFVSHNKLQAVRETLNLSYPSYILALAMGSGKTALIGTIIATEFAMFLEYHNDIFVKNALVFAPGKTIFGALKELSAVPYERILPPRLYNQFMSSVKITYTQDGQKDIPVIEGSSTNIIITNTEKIRIQKPTARKKNKNIGSLDLKHREKEEATEEMANNRLRKIASLPNLAIFSDEAHHTYGQSLEKELKKVRQTVDYLSDNNSVKVVVNTTGTPYYKKQMLKDVVFWYGLSQGIKDGILKDVKDSIISYREISSTALLSETLKDFFTAYGTTKLQDGSVAKIAYYFPQTADVKKAKPVIQKTLISLGIDPNVIYEVNNKSDEKTKDYFNNRVNEPHNPYRVYLLVNMGTEGWNCPSLFATVLARKLKTSNNFVLQAASRCLRQVPGNRQKARIYLSKDNETVLDSQLKETYGESLKQIFSQSTDLVARTIYLRKLEIPPVLLKKKITKVVPTGLVPDYFNLSVPTAPDTFAQRVVYSVSANSEKMRALTPVSVENIQAASEYLDVFHTAVSLAENYRLSASLLYAQLIKLYPDGDIPKYHYSGLAFQLESQLKIYSVVQEEVEIALALLKPSGFVSENRETGVIYTTEILYHKSKEHLLLPYEDSQSFNSADFGFHYYPYNFDSKPEKSFFINFIEKLNEDPDNIEDIYFTGAITDPAKTDFLFEYKDKTGKWHNYTPDFILRKKDGKILIVEVKGEVFRDANKEKIIHELVSLNKDKIKYEILITDDDDISIADITKISNWIY